MNLKRKQASLKSGFLRGFGISTYIEACGGGGPEYASVTVGKNGNITVKIGTQSNGQGHETSYAQIISEILEVDPSLVQILQGNSKEIEKGSGTGGSRSTLPVGGSALKVAAEKLLNDSKIIISNKFGIEENSIIYKRVFIERQKI